MRKAFTENLPKLKYEKNKDKINWNETSGYIVKFIYDDIEGEIKIINYIRSSAKLNVEYNNIQKTIATSSLINARLGKFIGKITKDFKFEIGYIMGNIIVTDRKYIINSRGVYEKCYRYTCTKCGFDNGWQKESNLKNKMGCSCCKGRTVVYGINSIHDTAPWMIDLGVDIEEAKMCTCCSNGKIKCICPTCGEISHKTVGMIYKTKTISCNKCSDGISYPNKFMFNILKQLNIDFETEYSPEWIKPRRYDFYIPSLNLIIEMDGGIGHKDGVVHNKAKLTLEECIQIDKCKNKEALKHNIEIIRINCNYGSKEKSEFIINSILLSNLKSMLPLNKINWDQIKCDSCKSLVKSVCDSKKENENLSSFDLADMYNISPSTAISYLKFGNTLNWCSYDAKKEKYKSSYRCGKASAKKIEILKNGISLGVFSCAMELDNKSEELFGVKLICQIIRRVASGRKTTPYKGFIFKYI